jgi:hypothetical protein
MVTYTLAGSLTSVLLGAGLGLAGALALPKDVGLPAGLLGLGIASLALARELGVVAIPLPQIGRQTQGMWAKSYGFTAAALLWGLDLGLVFTTWLTLSGAWVLALAAFLVGEPVFGAALFGAYWLGRALSVWVGPLLMERATDTPGLLATLYAERRLFRASHVAGLACTMLVFGSWILSGTTT